MQLSLSTAVVALAVLVGTAVGESHNVRFVLRNGCQNYTAILISADGKILSSGAEYTSDGPLIGATAYLQARGNCGPLGENCTVIQTTLANVDETNSAGSSTAINLDLPYAFSAPASFSYSKGCDGSGATCDNEDCPATDVTVMCRADDVNLAVTFTDCV